MLAGNRVANNAEAVLGTNDEGEKASANRGILFQYILEDIQKRTA